MASVVFIIRVPYEKAITKDSKAEDINETLKESEEEDVIGSAADPNVKEVKFENDEKTDKTPNQDEAKDGYETNEANQTADDIEIFTGPLNLAEVGFLTRTDISLILCVNSSNRITKIMNTIHYCGN